ncbi:MAG: hypothetical protein ACLS90_03115 [Clostridia bacterium]
MFKEESQDLNLENTSWKNKNEKYLFELQKFLDITENVDNDELRKDIVAQMLRCDKRLTQIAEEVFVKIKVEK